MAPGTQRPADDTPARGPRGALALATLLLVAAAGLAVAQEGPQPPAPPPAVSLRVVGERISATRTAVLVVPVEVANSGPAVTVTGTTVWAAPVVDEAASAGATRVPAGGRARLAVIVAPDCRLLRAGWDVRFVATVSVRLRAAGAAGTVAAEPVLDLAADPAVAAAVTAACGTGA